MAQDRNNDAAFQCITCQRRAIFCWQCHRVYFDKFWILAVNKGHFDFSTYLYMTAVVWKRSYFVPLFAALGFYCQNIVLLRPLLSSILSWRGVFWVWWTGRERRQDKATAAVCRGWLYSADFQWLFFTFFLCTESITVLGNSSGQSRAVLV